MKQINARQWALIFLFIVTLIVTYLLTPKKNGIEFQDVDLEYLAPQNFGDWQQVKMFSDVVSVKDGGETMRDQPYDKTLFRTYRDRNGTTIMLALAWGSRQRQDVKVHRPEVCYPAQGYKVLERSSGNIESLSSPSGVVPTVRLLAGGLGRIEAVQYWIRIGSQYGGDGLAMRTYILREGLQGRIPDGILVRASQIIPNQTENQRAQEILANFLTQLVQAVPAERKEVLVR